MAFAIRQLRHALAAANHGKRKLRHDDGNYARNYIRGLAQRVEVFSKTNVRIRATRTELPRIFTAASGVESAEFGTRGFGPKCAQTMEPVKITRHDRKWMVARV